MCYKVTPPPSRPSLAKVVLVDAVCPVRLFKRQQRKVPTDDGASDEVDGPVEPLATGERRSRRLVQAGARAPTMQAAQPAREADDGWGRKGRGASLGTRASVGVSEMRTTMRALHEREA